MLSGLLAKGLGKALAFAGTRSETTIDSLAERIARSTENLAIEETVLSIREQLKVDLNLEDSDFVMVPALFERGIAVIPNAVNALVFNGYFVAAEPRGPKQDGNDLFEEAIRQSLASCDVKVMFVDAWDAYHVMAGEIHCGTNTLRRLRDAEWWKYTT
jgi:protein-arginine deiminase